MNNPRVSVVLPVYNGGEWLAGAVRSVIEQTLEDFELIIIDDGSKDESWAVISSLSDPRIRAIRQSNKGLAATLNVGLELARAPYVARQDQDDWMHPERLERQCAFMDTNADCVGVGTWAEIRVDDKPTGRFHHHPTQWDAIRFFLMFDNPFVHSSMMLRREAVLSIGGYCEDKSRQPPEDYELWSRMARSGRLANIGEMLTAYREVPGSMSRSGPNPFLEKVVKIGAENLFLALQERFSMGKCLALSSCYHNAQISGAPASLRDVLRMLGALRSSAIGSSRKGSDEFEQIFHRTRRLLIARVIDRYDVLGLARIGRRMRRLVRESR